MLKPILFDLRLAYIIGYFVCLHMMFLPFVLGRTFKVEYVTVGLHIIYRDYGNIVVFSGLELCKLLCIQIIYSQFSDYTFHRYMCSLGNNETQYLFQRENIAFI